MSTILVTGSSGKTSSRLTAILHQEGHKFLIASRKGTAPAPYEPHAVKFDWTDGSTWANPFNASSDIAAVYLVAVADDDLFKRMSQFIDFAKTKGVKRFVLLSASAMPPGGPLMGQVHQRLIDLEKADGTEWAVVRPTWFAENFSDGVHAASVRDASLFNTAAGDGKVPLVSAHDIAAVAYRALVDEKPHNTDHVVLGPELLTYDEVASRLSKILGRPIRHKHNTVEEQAEFFAATGHMGADYAKALAGMDMIIKSGAEDRLNDTVFQVTGHQPRKIDDVFEENKAAWLS